MLKHYELLYLTKKKNYETVPEFIYYYYYFQSWQILQKRRKQKREKKKKAKISWDVYRYLNDFEEMKDMSWGNQIEQFTRRQPEAFRLSLFEREKLMQTN